jgi:hypothetical protein
MIKTNMITVILMAFSGHRQTIAAARRPRRTPTNGLEMANQKEKLQPESWAIEFVSTVLFKDFKSDISQMREISCAIEC